MSSSSMGALSGHFSVTTTQKYLLYLGVRVSFNSDGFSNRISRPASNVVYQDNMRQGEKKPRKGKIIFGNNARPLPKLLTE